MLHINKSIFSSEVKRKNCLYAKLTWPLKLLLFYAMQAPSSVINLIDEHLSSANFLLHKNKYKQAPAKCRKFKYTLSPKQQNIIALIPSNPVHPSDLNNYIL
jgi:hypothetical protein